MAEGQGTQRLMFQHQGIWLPDGEKHFPEWMTKNGELVDGKGTYQIRKLREAMKHVRQFRTAVDVGAHVGLWSMQLAKRFDNVIAFEPVSAFRECFAKNAWLRGVKCFPCALGARPGMANMKIDLADTGGTHIGQFVEDPHGHGLAVENRRVPVMTLDSFNLQHVDFLKIDCEGYEHNVIEGARETLLRCKPCVIVEQKPHKLGPNFGITGRPAVDLLLTCGYRVVRELSGDFIMEPV